MSKSIDELISLYYANKMNQLNMCVLVELMIDEREAKDLLIAQYKQAQDDIINRK